MRSETKKNTKQNEKKTHKHNHNNTEEYKQIDEAEKKEAQKITNLQFISA